MENTPNKTGQSETKPKETKDRLSQHMPNAGSTSGQKPDQSLMEKAHDMASAAGEKVDELTAGAGKSLGTIAEGIRKYSPDEKSGGAAFNKLADTIKTSGQYLEQHGMSDISDDIASLIRKNPGSAIVVAMGLGFILARATSRS